MCKILFNAQKRNYGEIVSKKSRLKVPQLGHFLVYCPFMGIYFSSVDIEMGVHVSLREVCAYGRCPLAEVQLYIKI